MPIALLALTLSAFAIGTTEFVIVGLLPTIGADLGVSLPSAGLLVSLYALGVAIGAPVLTALTGKVPRKLLLLSLMVLFTLGNLLAWLAPRRVLLHRLDHCHQPGAQGKGRQRDCNHVHRPDRGIGHRRAAGHVHRSAFRLA